MTSESNVEPISKTEGLHVTGTQRMLLLQLCDGMNPKEKDVARIYGRVFNWAASGEWANYDDWYDPTTKKLDIPSELLTTTSIIDADKKQQKAIVRIIVDALALGIIPGSALRKIDKIYKQIEGESLVSD